MRQRFNVLSALCALVCCTTLQLQYTMASVEVEKMNAGINQFSATFVKGVDAKTSTVSSPLSCELVLALVALGATGSTRAEILSALHIPDDEVLRSGLKEISTQLKKVKGVTFSMANKLYVKEGSYQLHENFNKNAVEVFNAEVEKVNFDNAIAAAKIINAWVGGKTNKKITDLISSDCLGPDTRLVLINALYFKGTWKYRFDPKLTQEEPFHVSSTKTINVPFMNIEKSFRYGRSNELDSQLLEIPYKGDEASMLIILPNQVDGLSDVIDKLAGGVDLQAATREMHPIKTQLSLPKFKIETEIDLKDLLSKMGVRKVFDPSNAELTGVLSTSEPLFVSKAVQKAFIEVNEEGAEAAAATGMRMMLCSMPRPPMLFVVDRPFYFALRSQSTMLFVGAFRADEDQQTN